MTTFALIHGAWGSGWHWAEVPAELRRMGHAAVAPDLPCDDPGATFEDYAGVVLDALAAVEGDDVVVAGYSLGGLTAPIVAARRPVRELVYVGAVVPEPGKSLMDQLGGGDRWFLPEYLAGLAPPDERGVGRWADIDVYRRVGYDADADPAVIEERFARLRGQATSPFAVACPLTAHPDVPTATSCCRTIG